MTIRTVLALGLSLGICGTVLAADPKPAAAVPEKKKEEKPTYLTIEDAGPDFKVQGEYGEAEAGKAKYGVQVIALAKDQFRAVIYPGGVPGAGWDGDKKNKIEIDGKRQGEITRTVGFEGKGWVATIPEDGSAINIKTDKGDSLELKKVMRKSPTEGAKPPEGAKVLYGGPEDAMKWNNGHVDARGLMGSGATTKDKFQNYTLHAEFLLPFKPAGRGQDRANSGVYMQNRYEVQVLDSFGLKGENNECGGIYSKTAPSVNMCYPPLQWQTYDIDFEAAKFEGGKKVKNAVITVRQNGVLIHDKAEIAGPTGGGKPETPDGGEIQLQGHGNPVFYRNVWIVEK
jgi:hypothetical protein